MHRNRPDAALAPLVAALVILASPVSAAVTGQAANLTPSVERMTVELVAAHGEAQRGRIWNRFYAPVFGRRDVVLLGIYSHMIDSTLYLPEYPVGAMIARQVEQQIARSGNLGAEFERMTRQGRLTPDLWMQKATGAPVGPAALIEAAERALEQLR